MKVIAFNGSPRKNGNTSQLLDVLLKEIEGEGIETERIDICSARPRGCTACYACAKNLDRKCVITDDPINEWIKKAVESDGLIIASPTYFANVTSETKALIDRLGFVSRVNDNLLARKAAAAVVAVRRGGAVPAFDAINHMFQISRMYIVGSCYWNFGFGLQPGEVMDDEEAIETMQVLGQNMSWLIRKMQD